MVGSYGILDKNSRQMKIIKGKSANYAAKLLVILFPMAIVPMVSYDFLIFYFKHSTVIYSSMIFGLLVGVNLLYIIEKIPKKILRK
jgi:hypothetical protein